MNLDTGYYFAHPNKLPIPELWSDDAPYEILTKIKPVLNGFLDGKEYHVGEGTAIRDGVTIMGPAYIGNNCDIMPGVTIRPYAIIGDNCSIGHASEIKHSVMFSGSKIASLAFVGNSVLGASARVGSGVITANRRFDQSDIVIKFDGNEYAVGDSYCGVILGDSSRLGANCVTQPGTLIGPYTWIYPLTTVRGFIPREKRVYHPQTIVMEDNGIVELS